MKAITYEKYGTSEVLEYKEVKKPSIKANEVLVRIKHSSINKADYIAMTGLPKLTRLMGMGIGKPKNLIPGCDFTGIVEEVGNEITHFSIGDHVVGDVSNKGFGAFAEYISVTTDSIAKISDELPLDTAATLPVAGCTAIESIDAINIKKNDQVLVTGASGCVGSIALQLAKSKGAIVTGLASTSKIEYVKSLGADYVVDYTKENILLKSTSYDYIINTALFSPLKEYLKLLKPQGTHLLIGGELKLLMKSILLSPLTPKKKGQKLLTISSKVKTQDLTTLANLLKDGTITVKIDNSYNLDQTSLAMDRFESGKACGKILINM